MSSWSEHIRSAVRQRAIIWANADPDLCRHMASLGHNVLNPLSTQHRLCKVTPTPYIIIFPVETLGLPNSWYHVVPHFRLVNIPAFARLAVSMTMHSIIKYDSMSMTMYSIY